MATTKLRNLWHRAALAALVGTGMLAACGAAAAEVRALAPEDWAGDLAALQAGLARRYANFEYTLTDRRIDLPAIAARWRAELASATSDDERRRVLERLLRDFRDPHLRVEWPRAAPAAPGASPAPPGPACPASLARLTGGGIAFDRLPEFTSATEPDARALRAGVLRMPGAPAVGIVRIPIFLERAYASWCADAAASIGLAADAPCDDACEQKLGPLAARRANVALAATLSALERAGAKRIAIDVTDNGGGSDWAEVAARLFAGPLGSARIGMLRDPAWVAYVDRRLADLATEREKAGPQRRRALDRGVATLVAARARLAEPCDLSAAWTDRAMATGGAPLPCTTLVSDVLYATGLERGLPPPEGDDGTLFTPAWYGLQPARATRLPLVVFVNGETHSAAEQFAAVLRDNGRARIAGSPSAGAGCGTFTGEGTGFTLPATGAVVHVPDCVRLRADGTNERRGIVPDRAVPWAPSDSAYQRARKAADALSR